MHSILSIVLFLAFLGTAASEGQYSDDSWKAASEYLRSSMNTSVNECKNFYKHVCGNFGRAPVEIGEGLEGASPDLISDTPADKAESEFESKEKAIMKALTAQIAGIDKTDNSSFETAFRNLYDGCLASQQIFPDQVLRRLYNAMGQRIGYLAILGGDADKKPWHVLGTITRELGNTLAVIPDVGTGYTEETKPILYVYPNTIQAGSVYEESQARDLVTTLARVTGKKVAAKDIDQLINELNAFRDDWTTVSDSDRLPYPLLNTVANLTSKGFGRGSNTTSADWDSYLEGLLPADVHKKWLADPSQAYISISDYSLLSDLSSLLKRHTPETIHAFAFLESLISVLTMTRNESSQLHVPSTTEQRCVKFAYDSAPAAAARLILKKNNIDPVAWRDDIVLLADRIKAAFKYLIGTIDWLDGADKVKVSKRLDEISVNPGLPDWIGDDAKVAEVVPKFDPSLTLYENEFEFEKQVWQDTLRQLVDGIDNGDPQPDFEVNASYQAKTVNVNFGLALPPQYSINYPLPLKYGGLGFVIAHELFHAFDPDQVSEDEEDVRKYFKPNSMKEYMRRRSCIIQQYSKYCNKKLSKCVSGDSTANDNIGDVDGLKVAYAAYKFASQVFGGEPPVPQFVGRTGDQMFFIAFARMWCVRSGKKSFLQSPSSSHAPPRARVDLSVANFPAFAASFHCPVGSKFAPLKKCSLWGESFSPVPVQGIESKRRR